MEGIHMKYEIIGGQLPVVSCTLEKNERMVTESGGMCWMDDCFEMETSTRGGAMKGLMRAFSGESIFMTSYTCIKDQGTIAFGSSFPGRILPIELDGSKSIIAQKTAFLASEEGVELNIHFRKRLGSGFFGGEGFILQRLSGKGVAFCPHCDGPFYKGKHVAVIGGGNSGIEAAIDLAGICSKVTVFEFLEELKADQVLQEKAKSLPNVEILVNSQTTEVVGDKEKVTGIRTKDRTTGNERLFPLDGIFVQIGLAANSSAFKEIVATNRLGEIIIDAHCRTDIPGIYAAGDVSTVPYKQIIISMGEGAKAALSAFEDRIKGVLD